MQRNLSYLRIDIGGRNSIDVTVNNDNRNVMAATLREGNLHGVKTRDALLGGSIAAYTFEGKEKGKVSGTHPFLPGEDAKVPLFPLQV